jgi:hypothetical protein
MFDHANDVNRFKLDPSKFSKGIDILVSEIVVDRIQIISAKTGQSFSETAAVLLAQQLGH